MADKCTCSSCGAKSLYIQFFQFEGKHYCRLCLTEQLQKAKKKVVHLALHRIP
jgi:hypothetical protein